MSSKSHQRVVNVWVKKNVPTPWGLPLEIMGMMEVLKKEITKGKSEVKLEYSSGVSGGELGW